MSGYTSREPGLVEVLERAREKAGADVRVSLPAKVVRWDPALQQVDAAPCIKDAYTDEDDQRVVEALPVVTNVPVIFPGGGGFRVTFPLAVGDHVLLVFSDKSLDKWLTVGGVVDPEDNRTHAMTDAIALPGLHDFAHPLTTAPGSTIDIGRDGGTFTPAALGGTDYDTFMTTLKTHTHPSVGASAELAALTVPASSTTVKVSE
jgi:hypothetical protein